MHTLAPLALTTLGNMRVGLLLALSLTLLTRGVNCNWCSALDGGNTVRCPLGYGDGCCEANGYFQESNRWDCACGWDGVESYCLRTCYTCHQCSIWVDCDNCGANTTATTTSVLASTPGPQGSDPLVVELATALGVIAFVLLVGTVWCLRRLCHKTPVENVDCEVQHSVPC